MKKHPYNRPTQIKYGTLCLGGSALCFAIVFLMISGLIRRENFPDRDLIMVAITILSTLGIILILLSYNFFQGKVQKLPLSSPVIIFVSLFFILMATSEIIFVYIVRIVPPTAQSGKIIGGGYAMGFSGFWHLYKRKKRETRELQLP